MAHESDRKPDRSTTKPLDPKEQNDALLDAERHAKKNPRAFKDDALTDKQVRVEPDGTGPTSTGTFDTERDRQRGSGNEPATGTGTDPREDPRSSKDPGR